MRTRCWTRSAGAAPPGGSGSRPKTGSRSSPPARSARIRGRSRYQIVVERLELSGAGALLALLEARKKALAAEGLFDEARKRELPYLPETIGVVTSPTGAVIRDILHRIEDRFPRRVLVWPVTVQGAGAAEEIAAAIAGFNRLDAATPVTAARRADRRPRRRQPGRPLGLQRGSRGARRGSERHPADRRRGARDRRDADRPCRRPPGADADRGRRDRRAGARRPFGAYAHPGASARCVVPPAHRRAARARRRARARPAGGAGPADHREPAARRLVGAARPRGARPARGRATGRRPGHRSPLGRPSRPAPRPSAPGERPAGGAPRQGRARGVERAGGTDRDRGASARKLFLSGRARARLCGRARPAGAARDQRGSGEAGRRALPRIPRWPRRRPRHRPAQAPQGRTGRGRRRAGAVALRAGARACLRARRCVATMTTR
ncbi:Exodeoxyribonuclease 7 large subunit [Geodia barretti]|uniref:Exodeoxyribonuclease 7 large subunit n=1 Tax=Geodia barretti TaxID=519541 RepID=A0AA35XGC3_GEOBA|nr:Exodeoxyribonuclease 7 large subunit [Geodia barretti]